jgi:hypothetical protein
VEGKCGIARPREGSALWTASTLRTLQFAG